MSSSQGATYDVARDENNLVMLRSVREAQSRVVHNWRTELKIPSMK